MLVRKQAASGAHLFQQLLVLARTAIAAFLDAPLPCTVTSPEALPPVHQPEHPPQLSAAPPPAAADTCTPHLIRFPCNAHSAALQLRMSMLELP